jgi:hypothetical protein
MGVDGNEYVDLMCSYGPVLLGHQFRHDAGFDQELEAGHGPCRSRSCSASDIGKRCR